MAKVELIMPKMGESITEATILKWLKGVGDTVELDETILEIATDKVDSEIPSPIEGKIIEILYAVDDVVEVGKPIAILSTEGEEPVSKPTIAPAEVVPTKNDQVKIDVPHVPAPEPQTEAPRVISKIASNSNRFYSPLVKSIAKSEQISQMEMDNIEGSGANGRVTKKDILKYISNGKSAGQSNSEANGQSLSKSQTANIATNNISKSSQASPISNGGHEIIEMDQNA